MKNESQKTLYDRTIRTPASHIVPIVRKVGHNMDIARSKSIAHFAPRHTISVAATKPVSLTKPITNKHMSDIGPVKHPIAAKIEQKHQQAKQAQMAIAAEANKSAKTIKEEAIVEAFSKLSEKQKENKLAFKRRHKFINIFSIIMVLLIITGFFVYVYLPNISMSVASARAGINATYPEYYPDGYSLNGSISYKDGEVTINFKANTGKGSFTIKQAKSSWDSTAVKNQVDKVSKGEFITTEERGLTIYTYGGNAASWVNGGILYNITGDAPLSGDQIRRIATSL